MPSEDISGFLFFCKLMFTKLSFTKCDSERTNIMQYLYMYSNGYKKFPENLKCMSNKIKSYTAQSRILTTPGVGRREMV